jgi:RNA polymerase sigma factor (sigma-70 family)
MPDNDRRAWVTRALDAHERALFAYARRRTRDVETARDLVQETFRRLCEAEQTEVEGHVRAWLFTVCRRLAIDLHRKEGRMTSDAALVLDRPAGPEHSPLVQLQARRDASRLRDAIDALPDNQREVVRLKFTHGLSYKEIAEVTGLSTSNVGYLLHHGLKALKASVNPPAAAAGGAR